MKRVHDRVKYFFKPALTVLLGDCRKCQMLFIFIFCDM